MKKEKKKAFKKKKDKSKNSVEKGSAETGDEKERKKEQRPVPNYFVAIQITNPKVSEPPHDKTNKIICAFSEDSDQPRHPPSLIRVFTVCSLGSYGSKLSSCGQ